MTSFVALLRAVNVGGTGKLAMADLKALCEAAGFQAVRTYIASGNVVFRSEADGPAVKAALESRLLAYAGKPVGVLVRTAAEIAEVVAQNPFPEAPGNRVTALFLDHPAAPAPLDAVTGRGTRNFALGSGKSTCAMGPVWPIRDCGSRPPERARRVT